VSVTLTASDDLEHALGMERRGHLSELVALPAYYGSVGLLSLEPYTDEEYLGSFAGIAAALIFFGKKTELSVYIRIAEALETMEDPDACPGCPTGEGMKAVNKRMEATREPLSDIKTKVANGNFKFI